jgi:hypothetical protein
MLEMLVQLLVPRVDSSRDNLGAANGMNNESSSIKIRG